jgi:hypothetical protein
VVSKTYERVSKEELVELFQMGRMNFKKEYKGLKGVYPDIDKFSKLCHFKVNWKRQVTGDSPKQGDEPRELSQRKSAEKS